MKPFLESIDELVLVCDGATWTMLYAKCVFINRCFDALNLTATDLENAGASVVLDETRSNGDRLLVWTD